MKNKITILMLIGLLAGCKEKDKGFPDLSKGSFSLGSYDGYWFFYFQQIDSIDAQGKPKFKPWPTEYGGKDFTLKSLNKENTLYEKTTSFECISDGQYHKYKDYVNIDPATGIWTMTVYDNVGVSPDRPDSIGVFIGKCRPDSYSYIYGYLKYRAWWYCPYCPMGMRDRYADAVVQANIH